MSLLAMTFTYAILFLITLGFAYEVFLDKLRVVLNSSRVAIVNGESEYAVKHGDILLMQLSGHGLSKMEIMNCGATHCAIVLKHPFWGLCVSEVTHKPPEKSISMRGSVSVTPLKEYLEAQSGWVLAVPSKVSLPPTDWTALEEFSESIVFDPVMRRGLTPSLTLFMTFSPFLPMLTPRTLDMNNLSHMVCSEYVTHALSAHKTGHWKRTSRLIPAPWSFTNEDVMCVSKQTQLKSVQYPSAVWFAKSIMRHLRT